MNMDSPLMDEIEANLNECKTEVEREIYLFSLLKPFGDIQAVVELLEYTILRRK